MSLLNEITPLMPDFSLINTKVTRIMQDLGLASASDAFYFFLGDQILRLQEDEVRDAITDNSFLTSYQNQGGHDRGIDLIYIDFDEAKSTVHFFNCKYASNFAKTKGHFPAGEIDKILGFIRALMSQDENLTSEVNPVLGAKIKEIWHLSESQNPNYVIHICSNHYYGFEPQEGNRFERGIRGFSSFNVSYHLMQDLVRLVTSQGKREVDAKLRVIDQNYFEKSDGNIRALVANVDARDLIRIVLDDDDIRNKVDFTPEQYSEMRKYKILEDSFEDNVRVHLDRSPINRNIRSTALSEDNNKFFYYNNGITLTCKSFSYPGMGVRSPIVELKAIQIVNGSQTIRTLYKAFSESPDKFRNVELLCRICETEDRPLSTRIAEYTNSQNPVTSRDIRSIDIVQIKLEIEFESKGKFYERKRNQHSDKPKKDRLDAEKAGQVLIAFYNRSPYDAKNRKGTIFGDRYEEVFNETVNSDKVLLAYELFERIESQKSRIKDESLKEVRVYEAKSYIIHASYYILYMLGELARRLRIDLSYDKIERIWALYPNAIEALDSCIEMGRKQAKERYSHSVFFRSDRPKKYFEDMLDSGDIDKYLQRNP